MNIQTSSSIPSKLKDFNTNRPGLKTTSLKPSTMVDPVTVTTTKPPPTPPPTTSSFTTISSSTSTSTTTSEPDWSAVCMDLCKKGEGGALCNCDLPPLSRKSN